MNAKLTKSVLLVQPTQVDGLLLKFMLNGKIYCPTVCNDARRAKEILVSKDSPDIVIIHTASGQDSQIGPEIGNFIKDAMWGNKKGVLDAPVFILVGKQCCGREKTDFNDPRESFFLVYNQNVRSLFAQTNNPIQRILTKRRQMFCGRLANLIKRLER